MTGEEMRLRKVRNLLKLIRQDLNSSVCSEALPEALFPVQMLPCQELISKWLALPPPLLTLKPAVLTWMHRMEDADV